MFSIRQIQYFVVTVDQGSISGAAKMLGVSPQAVSKSLNDMEQSLGRTLFARRSSGLKPTPYGKSLFKKARCVLREMQDFEDYACGYPERRRSSIQLMLCVPRFANFNSVVSSIQAFFQRSIDRPTTVLRGSLETSIEQLSLGSIDAFVAIGHTELPGFDVNVIDSLNIGAMVCSRNPLARKNMLTLDDFAQTPLYLAPSYAFFNQSVADDITRAGRAGTVDVEMLDMSLHGVFDALVSKNGGIAMPYIRGIENWLPETCVMSFDPAELPRVPLCLVTDHEAKSDNCQALEALLVGGKQAGFWLNNL